MALPVQSCFNVLTLRQGTLLIAVVELFLSVFLLFLLLLGSADAQEMAAVLEADIEDSAQREGISLSDDMPLIEPVVGQSQNQIQLHKAQHLAFGIHLQIMWFTSRMMSHYGLYISLLDPDEPLLIRNFCCTQLVVIMSLYTGVIMAVVHLISCILLLYGTTMRFRKLMLPWISIVLLGIVFCCTGMLVSMFLAHGYRAVWILAIGTITICSVFYLWLVVYSHYKELCELEEAICSTNHHMLKNGYFQFPEKAYNV